VAKDDDSRMVQDPICGKQVDTLRARAVGIFGGVTYYFCSAECKSKFKDPRQNSGPPPAVERRKPEPARAEPLEREERMPDLSGSRGEEPVRYAKSRIRRITGEVGTPVVQIDLRPNAKKPQLDADQSSKELDAIPDYPPRSSSGMWLTVVIMLLVIAGGVLYFTMFKK
jgi:YHS domain-containing protein